VPTFFLSLLLINDNVNDANILVLKVFRQSRSRSW
jgi:hypothetical protein